ncbi:nucleotidyltransferase family protein [Kallotenue papyrolyticum]|uniref:nucleotidyltransferase family protein n=1 Tax=Kallotenue papyrolyticum TaxID=1325125 RepID=UPI0006947869|nr:nucleotidyltransferase family protein [Kallotenue papyrolyticum]
MTPLPPDSCSSVIVGVLLAAGHSTRMGQPKQLLPWHGVPLVRHMAHVALATQLRELVVVTGAAAEQVRAALADLPVQVVHNPDFDQGQSTSLRAGIQALPPGVDAAMVLLVDQPLLQPATIDALITAWRPPWQIVAPRYAGQRGHPVLFARALFEHLCAIQGDRGARNLLERYAGQSLLVDVSDAGVVLDMDTPEVYQRLHGQATQRDD